MGGLFSGGRRKRMEQERQEREIVYEEVMKAHKDWERAYQAFQEAVGKDEVDFAIYTLEAAERRYQIHLKEAKKKKVHMGFMFTQQTKDKSVGGTGL